MNTTLVVVGFVFIAAAILGGGLTAQGVEVPVISSIPRQVLLGLTGVAAILISVLSMGSGPTASTGTPLPTSSAPTQPQGPPHVSLEVTTWNWTHWDPNPYDGSHAGSLLSGIHEFSCWTKGEPLTYRNRTSDKWVRAVEDSERNRNVYISDLFVTSRNGDPPRVTENLPPCE